MKAMILAAGRGERMRPLTDSCPKPLLKVGETSLIEHNIKSLQRSGIHEIVINTGWLGEQLPNYLGDGSQFGVSLNYSHEGYPALETAGGIINALPQLGSHDFIVVNGDIYTDYNFSQLKLKSGFDAHIVLIANPEHHPNGDFSLDGQHVIEAQYKCTYTFSGIAVYNSRFFSGFAPKPLALKTLLDRAIRLGGLSGEVFGGAWSDIGTVERLESLRASLSR